MSARAVEAGDNHPVRTHSQNGSSSVKTGLLPSFTPPMYYDEVSIR